MTKTQEVLLAYPNSETYTNPSHFELIEVFVDHTAEHEMRKRGWLRVYDKIEL